MPEPEPVPVTNMKKLGEIELAQITQAELARLLNEKGDASAYDFIKGKSEEFGKFDLSRLIDKNLSVRDTTEYPDEQSFKDALALELGISVRMQKAIAAKLGFAEFKPSGEPAADQAMLKDSGVMVLGLTSSATRIAVSAECLKGGPGEGAYQRLATRDREEGRATSFDYPAGVTTPNVPEIGKPFVFNEPGGEKTTTSPIAMLFIREQGQNSVRTAAASMRAADIQAVASVRAPRPTK